MRWELEALVPTTWSVARYCQLIFSLSHPQAPVKWAQALAFSDDPSCASLGPRRLHALAQVSRYLSRRSPGTSPLDRAGPQSSCLEGGVGRCIRASVWAPAPFPWACKGLGPVLSAASYTAIHAGGHSGREPGLRARLPAEARVHYPPSVRVSGPQWLHL